jgi:RecA-family ATPase
MSVNLKNIFAGNEITPAAAKADMKQHIAKLENQSEQKQNKLYYTATELLNRNIEYIPCLVEPMLQKVGLAAIAGSSDTGKSAFLRYLCLCVTAGMSDFLGFKINATHKSAIYVSTEDDETATSYLLNKQNRDIQLQSDKVQRLRFLFDTANLLEALDRMLTEQPADIVCIDAFTDIYGRSMNESNQMRCFLNEYSQLAQKHHCLMMFLHHTGKRTEDLAPSKHNLLGSQAFEAKMRLVIELRSDTLDDTLKQMCIVKGNYLPAGAKQESYQLRFTSNMTFENTGIRVPFSELTTDTEKEKYQRVRELKSRGYTYDEIARETGYANKSSISRLLKKHEDSTVADPLLEQQKSNSQIIEGELPF